MNLLKKSKCILLTVGLVCIFITSSVYAAPKNYNLYHQLGRKKSGYYSQTGQDEYLHKNVFKDKKNGVFVEFGAHNGISYSNTKIFEELGWTGICIEPIPSVFNELKKNRSCICLQGCISDHTGKDVFLKLEGEPEMCSGLVRNFDPQHMVGVKNVLKVRTYGDEPKEIEVDCFLLNDILEEYDIYHIDLLSMDTEGGELEILRSIDYNKFDIDVILVENNFMEGSFRHFMRSKGYDLIHRCGQDDVYKKKVIN
ncbi:MAG: hypothetical protein S4CHLAM20_10940 [Chlamydiia bacterium]|nr:hypothetical protein [Chlamydiia bacterium]